MEYKPARGIWGKIKEFGSSALGVAALFIAAPYFLPSYAMKLSNTKDISLMEYSTKYGKADTAGAVVGTVVGVLVDACQIIGYTSLWANHYPETISGLAAIPIVTNALSAVYEITKIEKELYELEVEIYRDEPKTTGKGFERQ